MCGLNLYCSAAVDNVLWLIMWAQHSVTDEALIIKYSLFNLYYSCHPLLMFVEQWCIFVSFLSECCAQVQADRLQGAQIHGTYQHGSPPMNNVGSQSNPVTCSRAACPWPAIQKAEVCGCQWKPRDACRAAERPQHLDAPSSNVLPLQSHEQASQLQRGSGLC